MHPALRHLLQGRVGRVVYALCNDQLTDLKPSGGFPQVPQDGPALYDEARAAVVGYYT